MTRLILDCEVYHNYFLASFYNPATGNVKNFELFDGCEMDLKQLAAVMNKTQTVSFNGLNFDLILIAAAIGGATTTKLKKLCDTIISKRIPGWRVARDNGIQIPKSWDHIDLIEVAPGAASLKIYGARLNAPKLQDLPIEPSATISPEQRDELRTYCVNDLETTELLYQSLSKEIALRSDMSKEYDLDLRSKSDAQIAETIIKSELKKITGRDYYAPDVPDDTAFSDHDPKIVSFETDQLRDIYTRILKTRFELGSNGSVQLPKWLKDTRIEIGSSVYQMGIGGLHSCEKAQHVEREKGYQLVDFDVASYYPSIILQQRLAPATLGAPFLKVYQSLVTRRLDAKRVKDMTTADTLKIAVNGSFGKLGSKYSALYAPDLLIQTTITGQLALLMLIERLEAVGVRVLSANTDGIVTYFPDALADDVEQIIFDWMLDTSYELERTDYRRIASRDVNNYLAVTTDGKIKRKGVFAFAGLRKNPANNIIAYAVAEYVAHGTPIDSIIKSCDDLRQFVEARKVTGGAVWRDEQLGKAVRYYHSTDVPITEAIHYAKNNNRVPKSNGCRPCMDLPGLVTTDIDHDYYINAAVELLASMGISYA
jgi:DNA polymerase elongation subunit (family B)